MTTTLERGFKAWSERLSHIIRRDLDLAAQAPLPPRKLATYLDVQLWTPHDVPGLPLDTRDQLLERDPWGWSAVTLTVGTRIIVIYNPRHSAGRQSSNISHELSHVLLDHDPSKVILSPNGAIVMRTFDARQEDEASWLSGCLLLPRIALVHAFSHRRTSNDIADEFGVTTTLVNYRSQITGVAAQTRRRRN
jgi:hypothetical protein